jgi:hypothetical protein
MGSAFSRKVQLTRDEFLRQLPDAVGNLAYRVDGNDIVIGDTTKLVRVHLTDLGIEELGSLNLPMQQVDFSFEQMADGEVDDFMGRWDNHKLRMGG